MSCLNVFVWTDRRGLSQLLREQVETMVELEKEEEEGEEGEVSCEVGFVYKVPR